MAGKNLAKRRAMFHRGAEAARRIFNMPGTFYVCPLCMTGFTEAAVETGILTSEHVPPRSVGGKELLLTCKDCNTKSGYRIDASVANREGAFAFREAIAGRNTNAVTYGKLSVLGNSLNVKFRHDGEAGCFEVLKDTNAPAVVERLHEQMKEAEQNGTAVGMELTMSMRTGFHGRLAMISDLKTAYLIAFAALGYSYISGAGLTKVREQILHPNESVIRCWWTSDLPEPYARPILAAIETPDCKLPPCLLVRLRRSLILLPLRDDVRFYDELAALDSAILSRFRGIEIPWPQRLELGLDLSEHFD